MGILIKSAQIHHPSSERPERTDIFLQDGLIRRIGPGLEMPEGDVQTITGDNLHLSVGWMDIGPYIGEPGEEHHETIVTATAAALQGGYTSIAPFSSPACPVQSKSEIEFIRLKATDGPLEILPIGSISDNMEAENLAELLDMHRFGAVAFSDGLAHCLPDGLLMRALFYLRKIDGLVVHCPALSDLHGGAQVHESGSSVAMGLTGFPREAEYIMLQRDLTLWRYTRSRLLCHLLASGDSIDQLTASRSSGQGLYASVSALQLFATVEDTSDFNAGFKVLPPLREESDRQRLMEAVRDGIVTIISSNHRPLDLESKDLEFPLSGFGSTGLASAFGTARKATDGQVPLDVLLACFTTGPREALGLPFPEIREGSPADITLFDPDIDWTLRKKHVRSLGTNTALDGSRLKGRALGLMNKNRWRTIDWT